MIDQTQTNSSFKKKKKKVRRIQVNLVSWIARALSYTVGVSQLLVSHVENKLLLASLCELKLNYLYEQS